MKKKDFEPIVLPDHLQPRIVSALYKENLILRKKSPFIRIAFLLLLLSSGMFSGGWFVHRYATSQVVASAKTNLEKYMLILYNPENFIANHPRQVEEYGNWLKELHQKGVVAGGDELTSKGWTFTGKEERQASESGKPLQEGASGYFIILAKSEKEARAITRNCPHLKYNGEVVLKKIIGH